ncbi:restriction endonuclease subunit S [Halostagnicola sp. A56]|uniref:restriction endonuclease subunit S n=1 Tax=Halostagnicola sp. A56 TaxID=1495067 RepID=UPI0009E26AAC|nr:restriction endonuclease subunit S [Halostagnicola sp. A56]
MKTAEFGFSVTKFTDEPSKFCEPGDTLVTVKGSGCGKTTFANKRASISRQLKALRPGGSINEHYLYYWMQTKQELLSILAQGTSIPGLSTSDLTTLRIPVPSIEKQTRIGNFLSDLDTNIRQETQQKEKLQDIKQSPKLWRE